MKLKITYRPGEERKARLILSFVKGLCPGAKLRESDAQPPYKVAYLTDKNTENPSVSTESP